MGCESKLRIDHGYKWLKGNDINHRQPEYPSDCLSVPLKPTPSESVVGSLPARQKFSLATSGVLDSITFCDYPILPLPSRRVSRCSHGVDHAARLE